MTATSLSYLLVLVGCFQAIASQNADTPNFKRLPQYCHSPPPVQDPEKCCTLEPLYNTEELSACGIQKDTRGPNDCSKPICLLKQKGLLDEQNNVDLEKASAFLDSWAGETFAQALPRVKETCLRPSLPGPPQVCNQARLMHCIGSLVFANCPEENWLTDDKCNIVRRHMRDCNPRQ